MHAETAEAAGNMGKQVGEMIMHHITNSPTLDLGFTKVHLPTIPTFEVAGIPVDLSLTKTVVFMMLASVLLVVAVASVMMRWDRRWSTRWRI